VTVEPDARQAIEPHQLDQSLDLWLGPAQHQRPTSTPQAPGEHRQIDHQRRVGEGQLAEVDDHVVLGRERAGNRSAPASLSGPVLVSATAQRWRFVIEVDDRVNLQTQGSPGKENRPPELDCNDMVTVDDVNDALREVIDPELGLDFVELGLIYEVAVEEPGAVHVTFTLTSPGCPIGPQVSEQIDEFVSELEGVTSVSSTMTFSPPWTPELMSEDAKFALGF